MEETSGRASGEDPSSDGQTGNRPTCKMTEV